MNKLYEIHVEMCNSCALDCIHCSSAHMRKLKLRNYKLSDFKAFIKCLECDTHVYLTGGEPLLSTELFEFLHEIHEISKNNKLGLFTCGISKNLSHIELGTAYQLNACGLNDCYVSLYHYKPAKHEQITKLDNSYSITNQTIKALLAASIEVKAHLVVNKYNYLELPDIIRSFHNNFISEVRLLRIVRTGNAELNWDVIGVEYEEQDKAISKIIDSIDSYSLKVTVSGFPSKHPCRPIANAKKCQAGTNVLYVTYSGEVYPCACTKNSGQYLIGHITELDRIRAYIKEQGKQMYHNDCLNPVSYVK